MKQILLMLSLCFCLTAGICGASVYDAWDSQMRQSYDASMSDPDWADVEDLASDVDVGAETQTFLKMVLPGWELPSESLQTEEQVFSAKARMGTCTFETADGLVGRFSSWITSGIRRPSHLFISGMAPAASVDSGAVLERLREILPFKVGVAQASGLSEEIAFADCKIMGRISGNVYPSPFARGWFVFVDDAPRANWSHPVRFVFFNSDLSSCAVIYSNEPMQFFRNGELTECGVLGASADGEGGSFLSDTALIEQVTDQMRNAVDATNAATSFRFWGDTYDSHVLLISGGMDKVNNYARYWGDVAMFYSTLRKTYGIPKENISVCMSDGTSPGRDMRVYQTSEEEAANGVKYMSSPTDLDGDGVSDITHDARKSTIKSVIQSYASKLHSDEQLFVFITDHGMVNETTGAAYLVPWMDGSISYSNCISVSEMARWFSGIRGKVVVAMEFCYSGPFAKRLGSMTNFVAISAAGNEPSSAFYLSVSEDDGRGVSLPGLPFYNPWSWALNTAFRTVPASFSSKPWNDDSSIMPSLSTYLPDTRSLDHDGDQRVSVREAALFAESYISKTTKTVSGLKLSFNDTPQYYEYTNGVGEALFPVARGNYVELKNVRQDVSFIAKTYELPVYSNSERWTVSKPSSASWITLHTASGSRHGTIRLSVSKNTSTAAREACLTITAGSVSTQLYIDQGGMSAPNTPWPSVKAGSATAPYVTITWTKAEDVTSYNLYRSRSNSVEGRELLKSNAVSPFVDTDVVPEVKYYYWLEAVNEVGSTFSTLSLVGSIDLGDVPETPSIKINGTKLSWTMPEGANYVRVYRTRNPFADPTPITDWVEWSAANITLPSVDSYADFYFVKVAPVADDALASSFSSVKTVKADFNYTYMQYTINRSYAVKDDLCEFYLYDSNAFTHVPYVGESTGMAFLKKGPIGTAEATYRFNCYTASSGLTAVAYMDGDAYNIARNQSFTIPSFSLWRLVVNGTKNTSVEPRSFIFDSTAEPELDPLYLRQWLARRFYIYQSGKPTVSLTTSRVNINAKGGRYDLALTVTPSSTAWSAEVKESWVRLFRSSGNGSAVLGFVCESNDTGYARTATITIEGADGVKTVTLSQPANVRSYTITYRPGIYGSGSVKTATKAQNKTLTLLGETYTRSGYRQIGWASSDQAKLATHFFEDDYTANESITLYPVWLDESLDSGSIWYRTEDDGTKTITRLELVEPMRIRFNSSYTRIEEIVEINDEMTACYLLGAKVEEGIKEIGEYAFENCYNMRYITLPDSLETIGFAAFWRCASLKNFKFPENIKSIGSSLFAYCESLESVTLSAAMTSIPYSTFKYCTSLKTVLIPEGIRLISESAFYDCPSLETITLPASVKTIEAYAFNECDNLKKIVFNGLPPTTDTAAFSGVASGCEGIYPAAYASQWRSVISNGKWRGLTMKVNESATGPTVPSGMDATVGSWLKELFKEKQGTFRLKSGTSEQDLRNAKLLGVHPTLQDDNAGTLSVSAETTFEISSIIVDGNTISLTATITAKQGTIPQSFVLGGIPKVRVKNSLSDTGNLLVMTPTVRRIDGTRATITFTVNVVNAKFYQVIVE